MQFFFIYNPGANRNSDGINLRRLQEVLEDPVWAGSEVRVSQEPGDICRLARSAARQYDVVVACGGDGTIREVAEGVIDTTAALGVLPMGSGNDFRKSLGIPPDMDRALQVLREGVTRSIDVGYCNGKLFVNTLGMGFDGLTNYYVGKMSIKGRWSYVWAALRTNFIIKNRTFNLTIDGERLEKKLLMATVANGRVEGGSFKVAPGADLGDGKLDLLLVSPVSRWILPFLLPLFVIGKQHWLPQVSFYRFRELEVRLSSPLTIHADGERFEDSGTLLKVRIHPGSLRIITSV